MKRRNSLLAIAALGSGAWLPRANAADEAAAYPSRPVRLVVPYAAGGGTDLLARTWAQALQPLLGQNVIVEDMPGGNGIIGTAYVAKAPADGYTLYIATYGFPVTRLLMKNAQYAVSDFAPIIRTGYGPLAVVVGADSPLHSVKDLVAAAKAQPAAINVATLGDGSQEQMGAQKFQQAAGVKLTEVPYKGGAPAIVDKLNAAFRKGLADAALSARIAQTFGSDPAGGSAREFGEFLAARTQENAALIRTLGIQPQ